MNIEKKLKELNKINQKFPIIEITTNLLGSHFHYSLNSKLYNIPLNNKTKIKEIFKENFNLENERITKIKFIPQGIITMDNLRFYVYKRLLYRGDVVNKEIMDTWLFLFPDSKWKKEKFNTYIPSKKTYNLILSNIPQI